MACDSESLYLINPKPKVPTMFGESITAQKHSSDLVIYSALAGQIVRVAWPSYKGIKIKPSGIRDWLRARGLHWGCFCGMAAPSKVHLSSRIVQTTKGKVYVYCHDEVSTCKFFLNLSDLFEITTLTSDYPMLPKIDQHNRYTQRETADVVLDFHIGQLAMSEIAPFLRGFCGDFVHGVEQLASTTGIQSPLRAAKTTIHRNPSSRLTMTLPTPMSPIKTMTHRNPSLTMMALPTPIASTSNRDPTASYPVPNSPHQRLLDQRDILDRLAEGEGIPTDEWDGVIEKCYVCNRFMLEAFFKAHSRDCWNVSDEESQPDEWGKE